MQRPLISVNFVISADGKISSVRRTPSGWSSAADHRRLLELRKDADALLVGNGTLQADRMTLTSLESSHFPLRCIVSRSGRIPGDHPIFATEGGAIHLLATDMNARIPSLPSSVTFHQEDLGSFLDTLASRYAVRRLHCEGGGTLVRALAESDWIDEFHLTLSPARIFGGADAPTVTGVEKAFLPASARFSLTHFAPQAETGECFLSYARI